MAARYLIERRKMRPASFIERQEERPRFTRSVAGAYIDVMGVAIDRHELTNRELQEIGEFTRENVLRWLKGWLRENFSRETYYFMDDDFHAVCGDIDIPWAKEENRQAWDKAVQGWINGGVTKQARTPSSARQDRWKKLVVGQEVFLVSNEVYCNVGKVAAVTSSGVDVQTADELIRFDNNGKETEASRRDRLGFGPSPGDKFHNVLWFSAPEFQPWEMEDISDEELAAFKAKAGKFKRPPLL